MIQAFLVREAGRRRGVSERRIERAEVLQAAVVGVGADRGQFAHNTFTRFSQSLFNVCDYVIDRLTTPMNNE